jgi:hypothetical protein
LAWWPAATWRCVVAGDDEAGGGAATAATRLPMLAPWVCARSMGITPRGLVRGGAGDAAAPLAAAAAAAAAGPGVRGLLLPYACGLSNRRVELRAAVAPLLRWRAVASSGVEAAAAAVVDGVELRGGEGEPPLSEGEPLSPNAAASKGGRAVRGGEPPSVSRGGGDGGPAAGAGRRGLLEPPGDDIAA